MKLYAVVIGRKRPYVAYDDDFEPGETLAVYDKMHHARDMRRNILSTCGHTQVRIIRFVPAPGSNVGNAVTEKRSK